MRVLLVQSWLGGAEAPVYPIGLACLAAALGGRHEVRVFDPNIAADPLGELDTLVADFRPEAVGVSLRNIDSTNKRVTVFYYEYFKTLVARLKAAAAAPIIVGGSGFSMFAERVMEDEPGVDFGVFLEGETTFAALLDRLDAPETTPSVYYRHDGAVRFSGRGRPACLDDLPAPDFSVAPVSAYLGQPWGLGVETKRGCALSCVYCPYGFLNGRAYRLKSPVRVVDELEILARDHGVRRLTFLDSVFNLPRSQAEAVCRELVRRDLGLSWSAWFNEAALDRDFLNLCRRAGCDTVILSPDGYADRVLTALGKSLTTADILAAFELLRHTPGIEVAYNFFKNPPGQSLSAFLSMAAFVVRARLAMGRRAHFEFNALRVEPHTALAELAVREGVIEPGRDLLYPVSYSQKRTAWIEKAFDLVLSLAGK